MSHGAAKSDSLMEQCGGQRVAKLVTQSVAKQVRHRERHQEQDRESHREQDRECLHE